MEPCDGGWVKSFPEAIRWRDWDIRVSPLHFQRAVPARRGMPDRVALIDKLG
jgi:hypothetical protein